MKTSLDYYTINIGGTGAYYTLRYHAQNVIGFAGFTSYHVKNLAQNPQEAFDKASAIALEDNLPLMTTFDDLMGQLREITRKTAEKGERNLNERITITTNAEEDHTEYFLNMINQGIFPFGHYATQPFEAASLKYINWIATEQYEPGSIMEHLQNAIKTKMADKILPIPNSDSKIELGKIQANVTVIKSLNFMSEWGTIYLVIMVDENKNCIVSKGKFYADVGDKIKIKGTIAKHNVYDGQMQSIIQRTKVI